MTKSERRKKYNQPATIIVPRSTMVTLTKANSNPSLDFEEHSDASEYKVPLRCIKKIIPFGHESLTLRSWMELADEIATKTDVTMKMFDVFIRPHESTNAE